MQHRMVIECGRCPMRGTACADCVVTALLALPDGPEARLPLDADERSALSALVGSGLVAAAEAAGASARRQPVRLVAQVG